jgi:iron complex transport system substrate-binding protein
MDDIEQLVSRVLDTALAIHVDVGPGLFETVYEQLLANRLAKQGHHVERQFAVGARIEGLDFPKAFCVDLLVEGQLVVELKSIDRLAPVHTRQTLTYLRLMNLPLGLLLNFGGITMKGHFRRVANNYRQ